MVVTLANGKKEVRRGADVVLTSDELGGVLDNTQLKAAAMRKTGTNRFRYDARLRHARSTPGDVTVTFAPTRSRTSTSPPTPGRCRERRTPQRSRAPSRSNGPTAQIVDPSNGGTIDVNVLNDRNWIDVVFLVPSIPGHPGISLGIDAGSVLDLTPEFILNGPGVGTIRVDDSRAPVELDPTGLTTGSKKFRFWLTGRWADSGAVQLTYLANSWSWNLSETFTLGSQTLDLSTGDNFLTVLFPDAANVNKDSVTDAGLEIQIAIVDPADPSGTLTFGSSATRFGWQVTLSTATPESNPLQPGVFRFKVTVTPSGTPTTSTLLLQYKFNDGTWGTGTSLDNGSATDAFENPTTNPAVRQTLLLSQTLPTTIRVTFPATAPTSGFALDHISITDAAADFNDKDLQKDGVQLFVGSGWVVTIDESRDLIRVPNTTSYDVPIRVTFDPAPTAMSVVFTPELETKGGLTTGVGFTGATTGGTQGAQTVAPDDTPGFEAGPGFNSRTFIDVRFSPTIGWVLDPTKINGDEFDLFGIGAGGFSPTGALAVVPLGGNVWRFMLDGDFAPGAVEVRFAPGTWEAKPPSTGPPAVSNLGFSRSFLVSGATADLVRTIPATATTDERIVALGGAAIGLDLVNGRGYLEVTFRPSSGNAVDHGSIGGGELELRDANGNLVPLTGAPIRVGQSDTYRYTLGAPLALGKYTVTFLAGTFGDTAGIPNQAETEEFTVVAATAALDDPVAGQIINAGDLNGRGYVDVTFGGTSVDVKTLLDTESEITISGNQGGAALTIDGKPLQVSGTVFRYFFTGYKGGTLTASVVAGTFKDIAGGTAATATAGTPKTDGLWLDLVFSPTQGTTVDEQSINGNEVTFAGAGSELLVFSSATRIDATTWRFAYTKKVSTGTITATFVAGAWNDSDGNLGTASTSSFKTIEQAQSFFIELSGGIILEAAGLTSEPLLELKAEVLLEINTARKLFTLTFSGQLKIIKLGTVGATSGRFVLDMGGGLSAAPQFWGVATLETNFSALEQYGIFLFAKGTLQINTTTATKVETLTLKGLGPNGSDITRTFTLRPLSFALEVVGQARVRPPGTSTDLVRLQGGFFLSIDPAKIQIYATAELSFGLGDAQLTYGAATGLIVVSTGLEAGRNPGVAGYLTVGASAGLGLPGVGSLFQVKGSVSVMFNTTLQDQTFKIPDSFLPLLKPGEPTTITIFAAAPGLDGKKRPNAPPGGEVYVTATIAAEIQIGPLALNGFIQIQVAAGSNGVRLAVTGAVGMQLNPIGSFAGTLNLEITLGPNPSVAGRIHLTLGANGIPGVKFNGEFLLELNTSAAEATIQTFRIKRDAQNNFAGFERDAAGNLVVTQQTLSVRGGFRLMMAGKLVILDTLEISGRVDFSVQLAGATPSIELLVNGRLALEPIGGVTLTDSGFRITTEGLVARFQIGLGADFGKNIGLKFSLSATLAINTTSRTQTLGTSTVARGLTIRIDGSVEFLGFASGSGFVEIKLGPAGFELTFGVAFSLGGLTFRADGGAVVRAGSDPGFALLLNVHATANATVFTIDASGTFQLNTMNHSELGIAAKTFVLDLQGKVEILKVISFDASLRVVVGNGGWSFNASASMDFFGIATLSGSLYLDSRGNFDLQLRGELVLGTRSFGLVGEFSIRFRNQVTLINGNPYYVVEIAGSARVSARLFGITLAGLGVAFSAKVEGFGGRAKIELSVTIEIDLFFGTISKTAHFTIGYIDLGPPPVYLGGQENSPQSWTDAGGVLFLNFGDLRTPSRNYATDVTDEEILIEQLDGDGTKGTIKLVAFGRTNVYSNVTKIVGNFGGGNDIVKIADSVKLEVDIDGGSGDDAITYGGDNDKSRLRGGSGDDYLETSGDGDVTMEGGDNDDVLIHTGAGKAIMKGDGGRDLLVGITKDDELSGGADNDELVGPAHKLFGDAGDDLIRITITTPDEVLIDGGDGTDDVRVTLGDTADTVDLSRLDGDTLRMVLNGGNRDLDRVEKLSIDGRAGADTFVIRDLQNSGLTDLKLDLGKRIVVNGTRSETVTLGDKTFTREVPNEISSPDVAGDAVTIFGGDAVADKFTFISVAGVITVARDTVGGTSLYDIVLLSSVRAEGDKLTVDGGALGDTLDATGLNAGADLIAVTLVGGTGNDTLVGTRYNDVLDGGADNDTYTGGFGLDQFFDAGGALDKLLETFDLDMGLFDDAFIVGHVGIPSQAQLDAVFATLGLDDSTLLHMAGVWSNDSTLELTSGIFELADLKGGAAANTIVIGDRDGLITIDRPGTTPDTIVDVLPWNGDVTLDAAGARDLYVVNAEGAAGARVHINDTGATGASDELYVNGTSVGELATIGTASSPARGVLTLAPASYANTIVVDHRGMERVTLATFEGDDRTAINAITVDHRILGGTGDDDMAVGSNAKGVGTAFTNTGGTVDQILARLQVTGGSGVNGLTVDDSADTSDNTGELTATTITGLDMQLVGGGTGVIDYLNFTSLSVALGTGDDDFIIHGTHVGGGRTTLLTGSDGDDAIDVRTISGPTTIDALAGDDVIRIGSLAPATGGVLTGITANLEIVGGPGNDSVFIDDTGTTADRVGVLTPSLLAGLGMVLNGSAPTTSAIPSLVQVVEVANAVDGRFRLTIDGVAFTDELDFDASADRVRLALEGLPQIGAGNVAVTKAGTRWTVAYRGTLAGAAGRALAPLTLAQSALFPLVAQPGGPAVSTSILRMTDGRIGYTGLETMVLDLGQGRDVLNVDGTLTGTTTINGNGGGDRIMVETTGGTTRVNGQGGDDWLLVNPLPTLPDLVNRITGPLTLDGGAGSDMTVVTLFGEGDTTIAAIDTAFDGATNALTVNGSASDDQFLFRSGLIALLTRNAGVTTGPFAHAEKVTYTNAFTGGVQVNGRAGDDRFAFDDTSSVMSVNGESGNDFFQVGQLFTDYVPDALFGIPTPAFANTTRGLLSPGVSHGTVINGGTGDDTFQIFRNRGPLQLNGEAGDDTFIIRTFIDVDKSTSVNTGGGRDFVQYVSNAPVSIDGGDGFDTVVVVGTEANDTFVVTAQGIWGAGRFISYLNVERLIIEGMEGDDLIYVLSTNPNVETAIFGGLGSDTINVAADVRNKIGPLVDVPAVQANDLMGHSGLLMNAVESTSTLWLGVPVDGIGAEIIDDDAPAVILTPLVGTLTVRERGDGVVSSVTYTAALAFAPDSDVELTISTPLPSPSQEAIRSKSVLLSLDGITWRTSVTLRFTPSNFAATQPIYVMAEYDLSSEDERVVPLMAMIVGQVGGTATGGTATTLVAGSNLFAGRSLGGYDVVITAGAGAGQVRRIQSNSGNTLTITQGWDTLPTATSSFLIRGLGQYENLQLPITPIRVLDDEHVGVVITEQTGGTNVIEGGTTTYKVALTRPPLAQVTVTITSDGQVWIGTPTVTPTGPVFSLVFAAGDAAEKTVTVKGRLDSVVEGFHFGNIDHKVASTDTFTGSVVATTGRMDEFYALLANVPVANGGLRGMLVKITAGTGAGQVRPIWTNAQTTAAGVPGTVNLVVVQGEWDIKPDSTSRFEITGYQSAPDGVPEGTVASTSPDRKTITFTLPTGAAAPATDSLVGATIRLATGTGAAFFRTVVANTGTTITVGDPWGSDVAAGTPIAVLDVPGITIDRVSAYIADVDTPGVIVRESDGRDAPRRGRHLRHLHGPAHPAAGGGRDRVDPDLRAEHPDARCRRRPRQPAQRSPARRERRVRTAPTSSRSS